MKETRKIIPFLAAACTVFALFYFNPPQEAHAAKLKAHYIVENPKTWRVTWWNYDRSIRHHDFLFFSVAKSEHRPISLGVAGIVLFVGET